MKQKILLLVTCICLMNCGHYFLASARLADRLTDAKIHTEIFGSDHCPVEVTVDWKRP